MKPFLRFWLLLITAPGFATTDSNRTRKPLKKIGLTSALWLCTLPLLAQQAPAAKQPAFPAAAAYAKANIQAKLIPAEGNTWGYDILVEGERFIHQPSKPGLPGNRGFSTQAKARKVANLMIKKIRKGEMPPSITLEEMKKLNAI